MNQNQIQQLTTHLSQALDQNYDVVNMDAVLSVICALEGTTITKEQLEATRLAKYINQLRRRTKNEHLARRAKSLLKKWREMVGIQQTAAEFVPHLSQIGSQPTQPALDSPKSTALVPDSHLSEPFTQSLPSQQVVPHMQANIDTSEPPPLDVHTELRTNFTNLVNNIHDCEHVEKFNITTLQNLKDRRHPALSRQVGSPQPIVNEQSVNSVFNLTHVSTEKINEASVVIDIVSDSDENDNNCASKREKSNLTVPVPLAIPTTPSYRQKKLKKDKKSKDREGQVAQNKRFGTKVSDAFVQSSLIADSDIFSLSNSSMSSIFSGDATLGNSQHKTRLSSSELTFTGRFKSVNQLDVSNYSNSSLLTGQNCVLRNNESGKLDEYSAYDSSASCSRLSPSTVEDVRKSENVINARLNNATANQMPTPVTSMGYDTNCRTEYLENTSQSQIPKRRGRKKGSKGVDALIAKESSSLSQQIFFGGSTVKKVKTTKELFNEIQSRKLSVSMQSSTSNLSNSSTNRELASRAIFPRPTSSCSDTSNHSPQILETFSGNSTFTSKIEEPPISDSDTLTSEPSHDSNKSQDIKETTSLDSNSNSLHTLVLERTPKNLMPMNFNDVTTQLMHLIHSLNSPMSELEIEEMYQAQIVPCTCIVIEEVQSSLKEPKKEASDSDINDPATSSNCDKNISRHKNEDQVFNFESLDNVEVGEIQPKTVKSIFDLDFDDNDDPLNTIMDEIQKPIVKLENIKKNLDTKNVSFSSPAQNVSLSLLHINADAQADKNHLEKENSETYNEVSPVFTVHEDPDCVAKNRFYVQTNRVTSFHINSLHNFYIPNINGNWDSVDSSPSFHNLDSYTVTNGADVVPKYGLLTSDKIKKDLSSLKYIKPFKAKRFKSFISPFLGVAKCLPTCRRAKHKVKKWLNSSIHFGQISQHFEVSEIKAEHKFNNSSPLKVNIDVPISGINSHIKNHVPTQVNPNINILPSPETLFNTSSGNAFSNSLLKLANDNNPETSDTSSDNDYQGDSPHSASSSSTFSFSSLKETQDSINEKLKNKRIESLGTKAKLHHRNKRIYAGDDMKKKKHLQKEFNIPGKRIKTVLNGNLFNLSSNNNSSDSENEAENYNENEYENSNREEYAIVQRPLGDGGATSNHIVLTIKKTPSKVNSPANSMNEVSPNTSDIGNLKKTIPNSYVKDATKIRNTTHISMGKGKSISKTHRSAFRSRNTRYRQAVQKNVKGRIKTIDLELKHLFHLKPKANNHISDLKLHNKLFFHHELCIENDVGIKEKIINYSSSSSSYDDDSEAENTSTEEEEKVKKSSSFGAHNLEFETETSAGAAVQVKFESENDSILTSSNDSDIADEGEREEINYTVDECNDFRNNNMLQSFNSICAESTVASIKSAPPIASLESQTKYNSDDSNRCFNNNLHVGLTNEISNISQKSTESAELTNKLPLLGVEYRTGIRPSPDAAPTSLADKDIPRIQQFKEWHQVLQLKSYNNEPLIVLPYVLLE
ncbi:mediator of RNA polymerase II transcription subunit 26 [Drosophila biarmipes]|uniref:mediator of RNA polymerase II transcription subunit 26 n=1 Tax=Drosophila biarmipes TaxID=125945 RepID=UPI001CDB397B|nr:mediator of RNA polymerase II transcription subunit 26 [Drosophila biarmipes]XP_043947203.1 mediator of RNA polymerase II transcription subunit 26 [Drosophila biarmipes]XP_050742808.1 mediator of RNA polymerase II transcription subunit 26 [Drosophila biarmipes]